MSDDGRIAKAWGSTGPGSLLHLIRTNQRWTRTEIGRVSGLARTTLIERLSMLQSAGFITANKTPALTGGRPAETYSYNSAGGYLLVADIGGSHTRMGITDMGGTLIATAEADRDTEEGPDAVLGYVVNALARLTDDNSISSDLIRGIGLGVPGPVLEGKLSRPRIPGWDGQSVSGYFKEKWPNVPVYVDKDANIMAMGELRQNPERHQNMIVLKVGMGIGCGLIVDGKVLHGSVGAAGDIAHMAGGGDVQCACGQFGCLDAVASGRAIARSLNANGRAVRTSRGIVDLVKSRDSEAADLVRDAGRQIGDVLGLLSYIVNPDLIIVGGNLAESPEPLLAGIRETIYTHFPPALTSDLEIIPSTVGTAAGLAGAAQLALDALLHPDNIDQSILEGKTWLT